MIKKNIIVRYLEKIMGKEIGSILLNLREQAGFTQEQLCYGIYSVSELARIEAEQLVPGHFQLDRLLGRLGKSPEKLEYVLPKEIYEIYELQFKIQKYICHQKFGLAEILLKEYEQKKQAERPLHRQFIEQEWAQLEWMRGRETKPVLFLIDSAIKRTMGQEVRFGQGMALSAEELKLLLFRWEICKGTLYERPKQELKDVLLYAENHCTDETEKAKIYPYAVLLICNAYEKKEKYDFLMYLLQEALKMLCNTGDILYLPEIIKQFTDLLEFGNKDSNTVHLLRAERKALIEIEKEYNINLENYRLFQCWDREFELDYEVIQKSRRASGVAQEILCNDICSQETLSRIENGKRSPNNRNLSSLLERLNRKRDRINTIIMSEEFEVIEMKREYERYIQRIEYAKATEILNQLQKRLDLNDIKNRQYLSAAGIKQDIHRGKISKTTGIEKLYTILLQTLNCKKEKIFDHQLTTEEANILNYIAILYYEGNEKEKSIEIYRKLIRNYSDSSVDAVFHIRELGLQMSNLASCLEETDKVEEAMQVSRDRMKILLEAGKGSELGRSLTTIACILERKGDVECHNRFQQALCLLKLMKMEVRYELVKEYVAHNKN